MSTTSSGGSDAVLPASQLAGRPHVRQLGLLVAADDVGRTPTRSRRRRGTPRRFDDVACGRRRDEPDAVRTACTDQLGILVQAPEGPASAPPPRTARSGRHLGRAGRCVVRRSTSTAVPAAASRSAMSSRSEFVPQSRAATRIRADRPRPTHGPSAHQIRQLRERLVTERVDSRTRRQRVSHEHMQAFHPVRHAAG